MLESRSEPATRNLRHDEAAVSEVIGQILSLGILSTLLIASMWGFAIAKDNATERAVVVQGDALLQKVSSTIVQAALFAEQQGGGSDLQFVSRISLPHELEGHPYFIDLDPDEVRMVFPDFDRFVSVPLFQAAAGTAISVCDMDPIPGGNLLLHLRPDDDPAVPSGAACDGSGSALAIYLEIDQ